MKHDRCNGHDRVRRTDVGPAAPHDAVVPPHQLTLAERDQRLPEGHARPRRGPHPVDHVLAMMRPPPRPRRGDDFELDQRRAPWPTSLGERPASLPQRAEAAAGRSLPSERTEGRPHDQLALLATWLDVDALSEADAEERSRTTARLEHARQRGQYCTAR
jgi:hypothetical protein